MQPASHIAAEVCFTTPTVSCFHVCHLLYTALLTIAHLYCFERCFAHIASDAHFSLSSGPAFPQPEILATSCRLVAEAGTPSKWFTVNLLSTAARWPVMPVQCPVVHSSSLSGSPLTLQLAALQLNRCDCWSVTSILPYLKTDCCSSSPPCQDPPCQASYCCIKPNWGHTRTQGACHLNTLQNTGCIPQMLTSISCCAGVADD